MNKNALTALFLALSLLAGTGVAQDIMDVARSGAYVRLTTMFVEGDNLCFHSNSPAGRNSAEGGAHMAACDRFPGYQWRFEPVGNDVFRLRSQLTDQLGLCLEGNRPGPSASMGGTSFMASCGDFSGQLWLIHREANGYFKLQPVGAQSVNECLEGNRPGGYLSGRAYMAGCGDYSGQLWKTVQTGDNGSAVSRRARPSQVTPGRPGSPSAPTLFGTSAGETPAERTEPLYTVQFENPGYVLWTATRVDGRTGRSTDFGGVAPESTTPPIPTKPGDVWQFHLDRSAHVEQYVASGQSQQFHRLPGYRQDAGVRYKTGSSQRCTLQRSIEQAFGDVYLSVGHPGTEERVIGLLFDFYASEPCSHPASKAEVLDAALSRTTSSDWRIRELWAQYGRAIGEVVAESESEIFFETIYSDDPGFHCGDGTSCVNVAVSGAPEMRICRNGLRVNTNNPDTSGTYYLARDSIASQGTNVAFVRKIAGDGLPARNIGQNHAVTLDYWETGAPEDSRWELRRSAGNAGTVVLAYAFSDDPAEGQWQAEDAAIRIIDISCTD